MRLLPRPTNPTFFTALLVVACVCLGDVGYVSMAHAQEQPSSKQITVDLTSDVSTDVAASPTADKHKGKKPPLGVLVNPPDLDRAEPLPEIVTNVGVKEHRGDQLPLDLRFTNEKGEEVRLGDFLKEGKPVILDLGYYSCPMLCDLVMNGLCDTIKDMKWVPGEDYQIIFVSIDPSENHKLAAAKKKTYIEDLNETLGATPGGKVKPVDENSWHFLTGDQANIAALAQAVGFAYQWDQRQMQFAHPAVLTLLTPKGEISRYIYGVKFPAQTLKLSLVEASEGKIGSALDQLILTCFHYDPSIGSYTLSAYRLMRAGGYLTMLVVGGLIGFALLREKSRNRKSTDRGAPTSM